MRSNKRGISPLIAGVLLIAFTIALGAIIMTWARDFVQTQTQDTGDATQQELACTLDVAIGFQKNADGSPKVCEDTLGSGNTSIPVINTGREDLIGFEVSVGSSFGEVASGDGGPIRSGQAASASVDTSTFTGTPDYVSVIPRVQVTLDSGLTSIITCGSAKIEYSQNIGTCT